VEVDERAVAIDDDPAPAHPAAGPSAFTSWSRRSQIMWW
jgi:hypothetical protein